MRKNLTIQLYAAILSGSVRNGVFSEAWWRESDMAKAKRPLTKKQAAVLEYIIACIEKDHRTPTIRQIGTKFKLRSTGSVRDLIAALVKKGELIKDAALSRGARLNPRKYNVRVSKKR